MRTPQRQARDKGASPIYGIKHPREFAAGRLLAILFAENAMVGKLAFDQSAHRSFRRTISFRHRIEAVAAFILHQVRRAKIGEDRGARGIGQ